MGNATIPPETASPQEPSSKRCFLISPIGSAGSETRLRSDDVRQFVIVPVLQKLGFSLTRADQVSDPGMIMQQVVDAVIDADLVIADLTDLNPNVMDELAIRHETGRPVVIIAERGTAVPFDINQVRTVFLNVNCTEASRSSRALWRNTSALQ